MVCPRCKKLHPVETYMKLVESPEFEDETVPVYKCPTCKWIFAPGDLSLPFLVQDLLDEMTMLRADLKEARGE